MNLNIGILASVDSGKTTLSESMLFISGAIKSQGKIDNKDTVLDNNEIERERGITIFSKMARLEFNDAKITLVDTPGHADFTLETEMVLNVLDVAILLISGTDGVTGHTKTLWDLLGTYNVPTFIFINKMDQVGADKDKVLKDIAAKLTKTAVDFSKDAWNGDIYEHIASLDEDLMEKFFETEKVDNSDITELIYERKLTPVLMGSALKGEGTKELLTAITTFAQGKKYGDEFGGFVYKISRDQNVRLSNMLITGGTLEVKSMIGDEKVNEIRVYNGSKYESVKSANAGEIVSVVGLNETRAGEGVGDNELVISPITSAVLSYGLIVHNQDNLTEVYNKMKLLEEENPGLFVVWDDKTKSIKLRLLGPIQMEVLKSEIMSRFGIDIDFGEEEIIYKETIKDIVMGVGHFEPLRHYAEVCLAITPIARNSGVICNNFCKRDTLATNWQNLILTHLEEKEHKGVLTGSDITDVAITVIGGRAHLKHTEGGDFREATYRAVRQGLMNAESVLLEPYYNYIIMVGREHVGRVMMDIEKMHGSCEIKSDEGDDVMLTGRCPVATLKNYQTELVSFTHGLGNITYVFDGYDVCHNPEEVIAKKNYFADEDTENFSGSVFCAHGAGYYVPWDEVYGMMHTPTDRFMEFKNAYLYQLGRGDLVDDNDFFGNKELTDEEIILRAKEEARRRQDALKAEEKELAQIFANTYRGVIADENLFHTNQSNDKLRGKLNASKRNKNQKAKTNKPAVYRPVAREKALLVVDGYNVVFALDKLKKIAADNIDGAREELLELLAEYGAAADCEVVAVFDAYRNKSKESRKEDFKGISVYFTKENQSADIFIEQMASKFGRKRDMTVVSSDSLLRLTVISHGSKVLSSRDFASELKRYEKSISAKVEQISKNDKVYMLDNVSDDVKAFIESLKN